MEIIVGSAAKLPAQDIHALANYRYRVFVERLGWNLTCWDRLEVDQFDCDHTVYVIARGSHGRVIGCARLLPTTGPYLLADVFPQLLNELPAPRCRTVWELSRFAAVDLELEAGIRDGQFSSPIAVGLLNAAIESAAGRGANELITVSPLGVERLLRKAGFEASRLGKPHLIGGQSLFACRIAVPLRREDRSVSFGARSA